MAGDLTYEPDLLFQDKVPGTGNAKQLRASLANVRALNLDLPDLFRATDKRLRVDLEQRAEALWWATKYRGRSERDFSTLREAIDFVRDELNAPEKASAIIVFDRPPHILSFLTPEMAKKAMEMLPADET